MARVGNPMERDVEVIYQMPFVYEGIRGIADFLVRVDAGDGYSTYEPVDAKLTRNKAKPGHVLQLCFYAEAIGALTGHRLVRCISGSARAPPKLSRSKNSFLLASTSPTTHDSARRDRTRSGHDTKPCDTCEYCEFYDHCESQWRKRRLDQLRGQ